MAQGDQQGTRETPEGHKEGRRTEARIRENERTLKINPQMNKTGSSTPKKKIQVSQELKCRKKK